MTAVRVGTHARPPAPDPHPSRSTDFGRFVEQARTAGSDADSNEDARNDGRAAEGGPCAGASDAPAHDERVLDPQTGNAPAGSVHGAGPRRTVASAVLPSRQTEGGPGGSKPAADGRQPGPAQMPGASKSSLLRRVEGWFRQAGADVDAAAKALTGWAAKGGSPPARPQVAIPHPFADPSIIKVGRTY